LASVSGLSGTGAGAGTILSTYLTGMVANRYSVPSRGDRGEYDSDCRHRCDFPFVRNNDATHRDLVGPL
jgi:hypothetical protein